MRRRGREDRENEERKGKGPQAILTAVLSLALAAGVIFMAARIMGGDSGSSAGEEFFSVSEDTAAEEMAVEGYSGYEVPDSSDDGNVSVLSGDDQTIEVEEPDGTPVTVKYEETTTPEYLAVGYDNSRTLTCVYGYDSEGGEKYVSAGLGTDLDGGALYLNLSCTGERMDSEIGFQLSAERSYLIYSGEEGYQTLDPENEGYSCFLITGVLWSSRIPSEYRDSENFGASWSYDFLSSPDFEGEDILCRVFNMTEMRLLCVLDISVRRDGESGKFVISGMAPADVSETGEVSDSLRERIIMSAEEFTLSFSDEFGLGIQDAGGSRESFVVTVSGPFVSKVISPDFEPVSYARAFPDIVSSYAVTLNTKEQGPVTVYIDADDPGLSVYAFEPIYVRNKNVIIAPDGYLDGLI